MVSEWHAMRWYFRSIDGKGECKHISLMNVIICGRNEVCKHASYRHWEMGFVWLYFG